MLHKRAETRGGMPFRLQLRSFRPINTPAWPIFFVPPSRPGSGRKKQAMAADGIDEQGDTRGCIREGCDGEAFGNFP